MSLLRNVYYITGSLHFITVDTYYALRTHVGHVRFALIDSVSPCKLFVGNRLFLHLQAVDNDTKAIIA